MTDDQFMTEIFSFIQTDVDSNPLADKFSWTVEQNNVE